MLQGLEKGILKHHRDTAISSQLQGKILSSANWHLGKDPKRDLKLCIRMLIGCESLYPKPVPGKPVLSSSIPPAVCTI